MDFVVQWVRTTWTKRSRGGEAAVARNAAPIAFEIFDGPRPLVHEVTMREADGFAPRSSMHPWSSKDRDRVHVKEVDGRLRVQALIPAMFNIPPRRRRPPAVYLQAGQWLRWQLNYRFSSFAGMADWSYHLHTLNLAYGPAASDAFLGTPALYIDERGPLR
jgi:hypothetical protein